MPIDRRVFLASLAATPLAVAADPPVVIDTHTHFYDPTRPEGVPWPGKGDELLYRVTLPKDYLAIRQPLRVTGTVVVEASPWPKDNQWLLELAAKEKFIVGVVGNLAPSADEFGALLRPLVKDPLFRGIRVGETILRKDDRKVLLRGLAQLADADRALDVNGGPGMLADVLAVAKELPSLRVVVNHMANVRIDGKAPPAAWRDDIKRVAERPNVFCKLSALVEGTGRDDGKAPGDVAFYAPTLDVLWQAFGSSRLMYGSNWPVGGRFAPLATVQQIVIDYCESKGRGAPDDVFAKASASAYKWVKR